MTAKWSRAFSFATTAWSATSPTSRVATAVKVPTRDGAMSGPNADLYAEFVDRYPTIQLQASGGVRHVGDLNHLRRIGADGAITGRALLEEHITEQEIRAFLHDA